MLIKDINVLIRPIFVLLGLFLSFFPCEAYIAGLSCTIVITFGEISKLVFETGDNQLVITHSGYHGIPIDDYLSIAPCSLNISR